MPEIFTGIPEDELFLNPLEDIERTRRNLPHWYQPGKLQFVTFRLADSLPVQIRQYYLSRQEAFNRLHPKPWTEETKNLFAKTFYPYLQKIMDKGYGECIFKDERVRNIVVESLNYLDGKSINLADFVVMPNHVHFLAAFNEKIEGVMNSLLSFTTRKINKTTGRQGRLWGHDYFDRMIRNHQHLDNVKAYIADNPRFLPPDSYHLRIF